MLVLTNSLLNRPIASVQSGHKIATSGPMIIDPRNLRVFAFHVSTLRHPDSVLHAEDIRSVTPQGLIIDNDNQIMRFDKDLVRLNEVAKINFKLLDKPVYTEEKKKLGKVTDFVTETTDFLIMKIHVNRSIVKSLGSSELIIDRSQIVQVTDDRIVVRSTAIKEKSSDLKTAIIGKSVSLSPESIKADSETE